MNPTMHDKYQPTQPTKYNLNISIVKNKFSLRKTNLNFRGRHKNISEVKPLCQKCVLSCQHKRCLISQVGNS